MYKYVHVDRTNANRKGMKLHKRTLAQILEDERKANERDRIQQIKCDFGNKEFCDLYVKFYEMLDENNARYLKSEEELNCEEA